MAQTDVLIVGAGPTGLALALWLTRQGVSARIIDKNNGPGEASRAMAVQARTLELYRQLDLAEAVVEAGYKTPAMNMWALGRHRARIPLGDAGRRVSAYPFVLIYPRIAMSACWCSNSRHWLWMWNGGPNCCPSKRVKAMSLPS